MNGVEARGDGAAVRAAHGWLSELMEVHGPVWTALARRHCGDHHHGEDALTESLAALAEAWAEGKIEDVGAWMAATLHNRASERKRNESRHRQACAQMATDSTATAANVPPPATGEGADAPDDDFTIDESHWEAVRAALPQLPPRHREVIQMRLFDKLPIKDIAARLECSEGTVWSNQHDAIKRLWRLVRQEK